MNTVADPHPIYDRKADEARQYWMKALSSNCGAPIIPADLSRKAQTPVEDSTSLVISGETFDRLIKLTAGSSFLLYISLLAAVKVCLYKYGRSNVITVGGPPRGVEGEPIEPSHVLAIVDRIDLDMSFREFLLNLKNTVVEAYQYQGYPLSDFVNLLGFDNERNFQPQVLVAVKDFHGDHLSPRSDLALRFERSADEVRGVASFDKLLFSLDLIRRFANDFLYILSLALQDTAISIKDLSALTPAEKQQILIEWNDTDRPFPHDRCAHELLVAQANNISEKVAIVYDGQHLTYSELHRRANQLAHHLIAAGVKLEGHVALCLDRSLEMIVGILGVLKAGGVCAPMDPGYPPGRLEYMLNDSKATILITQQRFLERLPVTTAQIICLDRDWERVGEWSAGEPEGEVTAENLAYLIYTSGSTGRPKGVMVGHKGICNLVEAQIEAFGVGPQSRVLQFASLGFDASVSEIFSALAAGGSLHLCARESLMPGPDLTRTLRDEAITTVTLPPTALAVLGEEKLPNLRTVVAAGEACSAEIAERWSKGRKLLNAYGPTEATVCASIGDCVEGSNLKPDIGRPIANARLYILDGEMEPVPVGGRGELYISGAGTARGYWGRPELTAEKFVPNLFSNAGGARLYRTGDVCRYLPDGKIDFIGRTDDQVKVRGYRIELGEIEETLNEHPSVKQSVVIAVDDENNEKRLVGYVVVDAGATVMSLKTHVRERLPEFMVPQAILILESMPLTANGKIDRKKLPLAEDISGQSAREYVAPRTPIEEIVVGIFEEVLKLDRVGIHDNFFEIGGHSLLATRIISRVKHTFGLEIEVRIIFEEATAGGLARRIEEAMRAGDKESAPPLVRAPRDENLPLSFAQQRLWFLDQLVPNNPLYNMPGSVRLEGKLDLKVLENVINEVFRRHEALRTRIELEKGLPVQVIDEWEPRRLELEDLTSLSREEKEEEVSRIVKEDVETGFDLSRGPLLRVKAIKLEEEEHVIVLTMHHIVSDAWSMGLFINEIALLYEAFREEKRSPLPELNLQYADYAHWQRRYLNGETLEKHLKYWKRQLGGKLPVLDLTGDHPRPSVPSYLGATKSFSFSAELSHSLRALCKQEGVTLFIAMLAAFKTLLYRCTAEADIVIGTTMANRNRVEIEHLIGFFVNILPMRTNLGDNPRFTELLKRVKEVALGAYTYQEMPFDELVKEIQPERELGQTPLFNIVFGVQNALEAETQLTGLKISPVIAGQEPARNDLMLIVTDGAKALRAGWTYDTDLFEEERITRLHNHFEALLSSIVARPNARLDEIDMLSEAEKLQQASSRLSREEHNYNRFKSVKPSAVTLVEN